MIQSKLAFRIVTTIHTKKKQLTIDDENEDVYNAIPQQIRDTGKTINATQKGKDKQKKKV